MIFMRFIAYFLTIFLILVTANAKEFRINFNDEGMKLLKKRGFGKKTVYTNGKDEKGWYLKAEADGTCNRSWHGNR